MKDLTDMQASAQYYVMCMDFAAVMKPLASIQICSVYAFQTYNSCQMFEKRSWDMAIPGNTHRGAVISKLTNKIIDHTN